jgi:hypothetical protein
MRFRKIRCKRVRCAESQLRRLEVSLRLYQPAAGAAVHAGLLHNQRLEEMVALFWLIHGEVKPLWHLDYYDFLGVSRR